MMIIDIESYFFYFSPNMEEKFPASRPITLIAKTNIVWFHPLFRTFETTPGLTGSRKKLVPFNYGNLYISIFHLLGNGCLEIAFGLSHSVFGFPVFYADCDRMNLFSTPKTLNYRQLIYFEG